MNGVRYGHMRAPKAKNGPAARVESTVKPFEEWTGRAYGGYVKDGALIPAFGASPAELFDGYIPKRIDGAFYSAALGTSYVLQTGAVMQKRKDDAYFVYRCDLLSEIPFFTEEYEGGEYRTAMITRTAARMLYADRTEDYTPVYAEISACAHHGRTFAADADGHTIRWSGTGGVTDREEGINGAGYVLLGGAKGAAKAVISYKTKVAVVRERGITCITALGSPENFKIDDDSAELASVVPATAAVCGGELYFCADGGLCRFDGEEIVRGSAPLADFIGSPVCATALDGRYYVGCTRTDGGEKALYCYDSAVGADWFIDCPADVLLNDGRIIAFGESAVNEAGARVPAVWESRIYAVGGARAKTVKYLSFEAEGTVEVALTDGTNTRRFSGTGGFYRVGMRGRRFGVRIEARCKVSRLELISEDCDDN